MTDAILVGSAIVVFVAFVYAMAYVMIRWATGELLPDLRERQAIKPGQNNTKESTK